MLGTKNKEQQLRLLHIGVHDSANKNAGDTLLFPVVRKIFDYFFGQCRWELHQAWDKFSLDFVKKVNPGGPGWKNFYISDSNQKWSLPNDLLLMFCGTLLVISILLGLGNILYSQYLSCQIYHPF